MKISYEWLREYVNTKVRPDSIASLLTMAGHEVSSIGHAQGDDIFDIEVTANRPDCLCHIGIARELAAITGKTLKMPDSRIAKKARPQCAFKIAIDDKKLCPFYSLRIIRDVRVAPSPKWLIRRILSMGLRPVNNIVDITNFVLFETGHPLHAFDADRLSGTEIRVRNAKENEDIITIDGMARKLTDKTLVIADAKGPIAIAGIMGAKATEITQQTKNILLESAYFNPASIRKASFKLGLSTDSSYRFERGSDMSNIAVSSDRAAVLIRDIAKGVIGARAISGTDKQPRVTVNMRMAYLNKILGTCLTAVQVKDILKRLGYGVGTGSAFQVTVPYHRNDTTREADLIEEVARIYGYENIQSMPARVITTYQDAKTADFMKKRLIARQVLTASGFDEIVTYSLISKDMIKDMPWPEDSIVDIKNPLSREQEIMRPSLLPGIAKAIAYNISRQVYNIKFFELSNVYFKRQTNYHEEPCLALALYARADSSKQQGYAQSELFYLKGALAQLSEALGIKDIRFEKATTALFDANESMVLLSGDIMLGAMGKLKRNILDAYGITGALFASELNLRQVIQLSNLRRNYSPLPRFPYAYRDISFSVSCEVEYAQIEALIRKTAGHIIETIELLSEYRGKQIEQDQRGLAIRVVFRSKEKTLTEDELSASDTAIREALAKTLSVVFR
jgi:phenylalanyl-tRNA synthetase beta chain